MSDHIITPPHKSENSLTTESNNQLAESIELRKTFKEHQMTADKPRKLNYIFYNPNTTEETADFLIKLFVEVNLPKLEAAINKKIQDQEEGCS